MSSDFIHRLHELISKNELEEVITLLQDGENWIPESARQEISMISKQLREVKQQEVRGTTTQEKAIDQKNKIKAALTLFIDKYLNSGSKKHSPIKIYQIILWGIVMIAFSILLYFFYKT